MAMRRNLLLSGGVAHDFPATSAALAALLAEVQIESVICDDPVEGLRHVEEFDLVTVNMLRWRMDVERYLHLKDRWAIRLPEQTRAALSGHVRGGGGLLGLHGASICFDDWPEWRSVLGGVWDWECSGHPPLGPVAVRVSGEHPIVDGIGDFEIEDEAYGHLSREPDVRGLLSAARDGVEHPLLWAREVGAGRAVYDALGHHVASYDVPEHRVVVKRAALWALGDDAFPQVAAPSRESPLPTA
jgi:type 1 glutamine amidotransferase